MRLFYLLLLLLLPLLSAAQTGVLSGTVRDRATQQPVPGATVTLEGSSLGTAADEQGRFRLADIPTGSYNVRASFIGYEPLLRANVVITSGNANIVGLELVAAQQQLGEVTVTASRAIRVATAETPLSVQRLSAQEIKSNPGGNFDISKVVQVLPGVGGGGTGGTAGFRNDIIIRGGAPQRKRVLPRRYRGAGHQPLPDPGQRRRAGRDAQRELYRRRNAEHVGPSRPATITCSAACCNSGSARATPTACRATCA